MSGYKEKFKEYAERMQEIRLLSTPEFSTIKDSDEFSRILTENFVKIGKYAEENRKVIDVYVKPALKYKGKLPDHMKAMLDGFSELLFEVSKQDEIDVHLADKISERLATDEIEIDDNSDDSTFVIMMAKQVQRDYYVLSGLTRYVNLRAEKVRSEALTNVNGLALYLEKDMFLKLNVEARGAVLTGVLRSVLLYESNLYAMPDTHWHNCIAVLEQAESILQDSFYHEQTPGFDWDSYEFRIYYYGSFMAYSILPRYMAEKVYRYARLAIEFLRKCTDENILSSVDEAQEKDLLYLASVQAGYVPVRDACEEFYRSYKECNPQDYSLTGLNKNLDTPASYLGMSKIMEMELTEPDFDRYREIQKSMLNYLYRVPKHGDKYLKCVTLFSNLPFFFREVPTAMTMEEFSVIAFAAVHPPTYIHVNMVARLAECMTRHLLRLHPELFIGFPGCDNEVAVVLAKNKIIDYAYRSARCHDLGKLFIIDIISMYGRELFDDERALIKDHPDVGAGIAAEHISTKDFVDVIRGHHLWYDCSKGYPNTFNTFESHYKIIIDIVCAADGLDAATDTVGRSYSKGKTFKEYEKEVIDGSGTRYAPFIPLLLADPACRADLEYILTEGRRQLYHDIFMLIRDREEENRGE